MALEWNRENFENSLTGTCFSSTSYDTGWDGAPQWDIDGAVLQNDPDMRRLLELEWAIRPVPVWAQKVARQIEQMAPCGWCFPQCVRAVCRNIGAGDAAAASPCGCYVVGPGRLQLLADYALCLDGWLKGAQPAEVAEALLEHTVGDRDWHRIVADMWEALGERTDLRTLLVRRLLARLRFWLRAPFGTLKADDNRRLGYFYSHSMGQHGGWDYFSFHRHDPESAELGERIRQEVPHADRWLEPIDCTWPCAPKVFRYLERIILAIGALEEGGETSPDDLVSETNGRPTLESEGTYLESDTSRGLFKASVSALAEFANGNGASQDAGFGSQLQHLLGDQSPQKVWLAALLLKRIKLFEESFKWFHFTRNAHQA